MENNKGCSIHDHHHQPPPSSSSFSSTLDDNNNRSSKSLRLQSTLSELEWKIEKILEVVEDNGDTFAQRAQMYYQKRPELIQMLGDLRKSYRSLADKVVTIRSDSNPPPPPSNYFCSSTSNSNYNLHSHSDRDLMIFDFKPLPQNHSTASHEFHDFGDGIADSDRHRRSESVLFTDNKDDNPEAAAAAVEEKGGGGGWDELLAQVTELVEENTSKQAELVRRYAKKNEEMKMLVKENRRLRELLSGTKINDSNKQSSSQIRWKPLHFFRKLLP